MKPFTSTIPTDLEELVLLKNESIVAAYVNSLPPRVGDLHGYSVQVFFGRGRSFSIDGLIIDVAPKQEVYRLHFGKATKLDEWQNRIRTGTGKPVIEPVDLHAVWCELGLKLLLAGPREARFYKRAEMVPVLEQEFAFDAIHLYVPGSDNAQSLFFHASQDYPGDVVVTGGIPTSEFNLVG